MTTNLNQQCVYLCSLNKAGLKDNFPLQNMELILHQVASSQMMSLLDGFSSYNQIRVRRDDKNKTTFTTLWGTFVYEIMSFGLINAGATFKRDMKITFDNLIGNIIQNYLNDFTVYSRNQ
jgi:hypothetical protein